ncbi:MAG TPA: hypothetical protein PKA82_16040 [Pyrinomonadaceae bacterium]|nr:hypothetical protein [Pyrinomonadaceae bacterium]
MATTTLEPPQAKTEFSKPAKPAVPSLNAPFPTANVVSTDTLNFKVGAWLSGLKIFLSSAGNIVGAASQPRTSYIGEMRIARSVLIRVSNLSFELASAAATRGDSEIETSEIRKVTGILREPLLTAEGLEKRGEIGFAEWQAWCRFVVTWLDNDQVISRFTALSDKGGAAFLPKRLKEMIDESAAKSGVESPLVRVLPRFGRILRTLDIIGEMLERDEPLKMAIVLFAKAATQTRDLITQLELQAKGGDENDELMGVIDSASYIASLELKKVMQQELAGLPGLRPATSIYARTETAYALLTESLQQILAQFARHYEPELNIFDLFPNFRSKLNQSLLLRKELNTLSQQTRKTETEPDPKNIDKLNAALTQFMETTVRFLFYKDIETFERFVEEIAVTKQKTDLVPIVHRFSAYLETLFGQVSMRAVLEDHPFETA